MPPTTPPTAIEVIARVVLRTPRGLVLARQRGKQWSFLPGGHVEPGESVIDALQRELAEELGAAVEGIEHIGVVEHGYHEDGQDHHEINVVFTATSRHTAIRAREDHLEFHLAAADRLTDHNLRPAALKTALLNWFDTGEPFFSPLHPARTARVPSTAP